MSEVLQTKPEHSRNSPMARFRKLGGSMMVGLAPITVIYGVGYLRGNPVSASPNVNVRLEQILEPAATEMARQVLAENKQINNNIVVTRPDPNGDTPGEETISMQSIVNNQWLIVEASMYRDKHGQLDPTTVNDVDITQYGCDPPGKPQGECGYPRHAREEVEIILGDDRTYTKGNWGLEDDITLAHSNDPVLTINTATHNPSEVADSDDALHAVREAKVFSRVAKMWVNQVLAGKVDVPQLENSQVKNANRTVR
jgi:hypothetical protein